MHPAGSLPAGDRKDLRMPITSTQDLFIHELGEIYDAEHQFIEGQHEMIQNATDESLKGAIQKHLEETRQHAVKIEQIFTELGEEPHRQTNQVAQSLVSEAQQAMQDAGSDALRDCAIDAAVIKVEHFEMASYRSIVTGAQLMGRSEIERLLRENMQQEEEAARIAENSAEELLQKAMGEDGKGEEGLMDKAKNKLTGQ